MDPAEIEATFGAAAREALTQYPVTARALTLVAMTENVTFRVDGDDGAAYVLRLHRPGYHTLPELSSERVWLRALAEAGIGAPVPVEATDGRDYVAVTVANRGEQRFVGLTNWIEGEIVGDILERASDVAEVEGHFARLGTMMAALHNQATSWEVPAGFTRHAIDADGLMGDHPFWGRFWEHPALSPSERALVEATRDRIGEALRRYGRSRPTFSLIHADLHHNNVLMSEGELTVIDFDDAGFGWHQYDLGVALFHSMDTPHVSQARAAFFDSYQAGRPMSQDDLALVPMFQLVRGLAIIGWKQQRPEVAWPAGYFEWLKAWTLDGCRAFEPPC
jgi:Ser/Thr protein kinase RdoA (MazF antagonist)